MALDADGSATAGTNSYGQTDVPEGPVFAAIAAGSDFSVGLVDDVVPDGLGVGDNNGQSTPPTGNDFVAIAAGDQFGLARSDGTVAAWGRNNAGQSDAPEGSNFTAIGCGWQNGYAIDGDGYLHAWGLDNNQQVADAPDDAGFTQITGGMYHAVAAWIPGCNANGIADGDEIADGSTADVNPADGVPDECQGLELGACCTVRGDCLPTTEAHCLNAGGTRHEDTLDCDAVGCDPRCSRIWISTATSMSTCSPSSTGGEPVPK